MRPAARALTLLSTTGGLWPAGTSEIGGLSRSSFRLSELLRLIFQGRRVAELILRHARASECSDVEGFKAEMAALVTRARENSITLEKVGGDRLWTSRRLVRVLPAHWGVAGAGRAQRPPRPCRVLHPYRARSSSQLHVSSLLSSVFRLLMTHKVRPRPRGTSPGEPVGTRAGGESASWRWGRFFLQSQAGVCGQSTREY